jgi:hypothetical protein
MKGSSLYCLAIDETLDHPVFNEYIRPIAKITYMGNVKFLRPSKPYKGKLKASLCMFELLS